MTIDADKKIQEIIDEFKKGDYDDMVNIGEIIDYIEPAFKPQNDQELQYWTFLLIREMMRQGFKSGDTEYSEHGYFPWENQDPDFTINYILQQWYIVNGDWHFGLSPWFGLPQYDYSDYS